MRKVKKEKKERKEDITYLELMNGQEKRKRVIENELQIEKERE